ncbi:MAG: hypothetical protein JNN28_02915 [Saprospiraceae bacterium]|nr:hypothetical protein [Saprospiraceae bacterium]
MKQVFLMLVFWGGMVHGAFAGYLVTVSGSNGIFQCTISVNNSTTWTDGDLITWVFPDGQYKQTTISINGSVITGHTNSWYAWKPSTSWGNSPKVLAIVTKKGGTGNPSIIENFSDPITTTSSNTSAQDIFPSINNSSFAINTFWNFSVDASNYLVVTYREIPGCEIKPEYRIQIHFPVDVSYLGYTPFNGENVDILNSSTISIKDLAPGTEYKHVLLKLSTNSNVSESNPLGFQIASSICNNSNTTIYYEVNQHPHDPNFKQVNIKNICPGKTTPTLLHYKVQFHNDGKVPVKKVVVTDEFEPELNPATFVMTHAPTINGISSSYTQNITGNKLTLEFNGSGLPGLGQTNQVYLFNQTIYQFEFDIETNPIVKKSFPNSVSIVFYDEKIVGNTITYDAMTPVKTELEWVNIGCRKKPRFCDCLKLLFRRKR